MTSQHPREFHYKLHRRIPGQRQGFHAALSRGSGMEFVGHAPLFGGGDPRRLDIRASLANPTGDWLLRQHRTRVALPVCVLLDLSASMGFVGVRRKLDLVAEFVAAAGFSARRSGDAFGLIAADDQVRESLWLPPTHARSAAQSALDALADAVPGGGSDGLLAAVDWLPRSRSLVFLVSDFHFPLARLEALLVALAHHEVVPVILWDAAEAERLPRFGLIELQDPESGEQRTVLMRPSLRRRWIARLAERRAGLRACLAVHGCRPYYVGEGFDADGLSRWFLGEDQEEGGDGA